MNIVAYTAMMRPRKLIGHAVLHDGIGGRHLRGGRKTDGQQHHRRQPEDA